MREFYAMKPEEAYAILEAMAEIHDCKENLKLVVPSDIEAQEEQLEQEIDTESHEKRRIFLLRNVRFLLEKKLNIMRIQVLRARLLGTEKWSIKGKKCRLRLLQNSYQERNIQLQVWDSLNIKASG